MATKTTDKRENVADLVRLGLTVEQAMSLQDLARSLHRLYTADCNTGLTHLQELRRDRLCNRVEAIIRDTGLYVRHQSDPRGWPILVDKEPITENATWGPMRVCPY